MMFSLNDTYRYWLYNKPVDMRKSFNGLSGIVINALLPRLSRYVLDGRYNIDNNGIENAIRPLAVPQAGRGRDCLLGDLSEWLNPLYIIMTAEEIGVEVIFLKYEGSDKEIV